MKSSTNTYGKPLLLKKLKQLAVSSIELLTLKETVFLFKIKDKLRTPKRTVVMKSASVLGAAGFIWLPPALILIKERKTRLDGLLVFAGIGFDVAMNNLFTKFFFHRVRPCVRYPEEYQSCSLPFGFSFPSGHALTSATGATIYISINPLNAFWCLPVAGLISFSRLYLFDHYPSDVLVGMIDGIVSGRFVYKLGHRLYDKDTFPVINELIDENSFYNLRNYLTKKGRGKIRTELEEILVKRFLS